MEKRVIQKVEEHTVSFKMSIKDWITTHNMSVISNNTDHTSEFLKFIFDYQGVDLGNDDFQRRKRTKNVVPHCERCIARRANGEQCTRRRTGEGTFCGTHIKGTPHGLIAVEGTDSAVSKVTVWVEEINGINYYLDNAGNVYRHEDVFNNIPSPAVIAKWVRHEDGSIHIPEYDI